MRQLAGLPEFIISLGGRRLAAADSARVITIRVHSALAQPTQCVLVWAADDTLGVNPDTGDALRIEIGGYREPLFVGEVTVVEYSYRADTGRQLRVRGYDALHRLRKRQSTRLLDATDLRGLAEALVAGTGLAVEGPAEPVGPIYQVARSDLGLLVEVTTRHGHYPVVHDRTLKLVPLAGDGDPVTLSYGQTLHAAEIEISAEPAFRSVETSWWDAASTQTGVARVADSQAAPAVSADPGPTRLGGGGALLRQDDLQTGPGAEPRTLAAAELDIRRMGEITAVLVTDGDPALQAGRRVRVAGVRAELEGTYTITSATHDISATGYETTVSTRPPAPPPARSPDQVTLGVVLDANDPEDRGRVIVQLPAYAGLPSGWAPVLLPAAGDDKGIVAIPDVDDHVLVLLPGRDPAQAIVLGGLYGSHTPPPPAPHQFDRGTTAVARTRDGQQLILDGSNSILSLTDGHGSSIELTPELLRITAATDLLIEAPGRALRVRALTVDFEEAP